MLIPLMIAKLAEPVAAHAYSPWHHSTAAAHQHSTCKLENPHIILKTMIWVHTLDQPAFQWT